MVQAGLLLRSLGFDSKPDHVIFVLGKVALGQVLLRVFRSSPITISPTVFYTLLHLHAAFTRRKNGRRLGAFPKTTLLRKSGKTEFKGTSISVFFSGFYSCI
jgi:hypothetical protein